jgi:NodT family efflux transporter outer membrane factor (OMF) lipoprotein
VADLGAAAELLRDTLVTLQGEVARNYIDYRGYQLRLEIARKAVQIRQESLEITEARVRAGAVSELDLTRARGELSAAEARVPLLEESLLTLLHRLGILLGLHPTSLADELRTPAGLPRIPENLPAGMPSDLLRRRPDIRGAEREVAAATARIGVSTAQLFPRFSLTGSFNYQANQFDRVFRDSSNLWSIGPRFSWAILNFKRILADVELSREIRQEALIRYERSVLNSLEEVENSLVRLSREKERIAFLTESVASNDLAVKLANERYVAGLQSYLAVIDALDAQYTAQDELAQSLQSYALGFVALYKSLGGGWSDFYVEEEWNSN